MRSVLSIITALAVLSFFQCKPSPAMNTEEVQVTSTFSKMVDDQMAEFVKDSEVPNNFYHPLRTFYFDRDSLSLDSLVALYQEGKVAAVFTEIEHIIIESPEVGESTSVVFSEEGDSIGSFKSQKPTFHFKFHVQAYSSEHVEASQLSPVHVQLLYNKHKNLFLSLSTTETGSMDAVVYNKSNGVQLTSYNKSTYDGSYYLGNLMKIPEGVELDTLSLALKVDDLIYHQDFDFDNIVEK